jgi:hypothetical protein
MNIKPILKAMLLCDQTLVEEGTRKRSLIGLFDRVKAAQFPSVHGSMSVYVQFREIEGVFDFTLELYDLAEDKPLHKAVVSNFEVQEKSRDCELVFNLLSVRFNHPGDYEFRIFVNDSIFGQKSFQVIQ